MEDLFKNFVGVVKVKLDLVLEKTRPNGSTIIIDLIGVFNSFFSYWMKMQLRRIEKENTMEIVSMKLTVIDINISNEKNAINDSHVLFDECMNSILNKTRQKSIGITFVRCSRWAVMCDLAMFNSLTKVCVCI